MTLEPGRKRRNRIDWLTVMLVIGIVCMAWGTVILAAALVYTLIT